LAAREQKIKTEKKERRPNRKHYHEEKRYRVKVKGGARKTITRGCLQKRKAYGLQQLCRKAKKSLNFKKKKKKPHYCDDAGAQDPEGNNLKMLRKSLGTKS